jgi:hypothetical protein
MTDLSPSDSITCGLSRDDLDQNSDIEESKAECSACTSTLEDFARERLGELKIPSISTLKKTVRTASKFNVGTLLVPLLLFAILATVRAQGKGFNFKRLNPPGATYSFAFGLNNRGIVVGSFANASGVYKGFAYESGKYETIVFPGSVAFTQASGVNDSNTVVGDYVGKDQLTHGYLLSPDKKFSRYDVSKDVSTYIFAINNAGNFVGYSQKPGKPAIAYVNIGGTVKRFTFQGNYTFAFGIDSKNEIVGWFIDSSFNVHGFYRGTGGKMTQIDYPGAATTECLGINDLGEITGLYVDTKNVAHGFIRNKSKFRTVSLPDVAAINNAGVFVGSYIAKNKKSYGYIATPHVRDRITCRKSTSPRSKRNCRMPTP